MWTEGYANGCRYWVKHYEEGSMFGINRGRVSKLCVTRGGHAVMSYDRGWDQEPESGADKALLAGLLKAYN